MQRFLGFILDKFSELGPVRKLFKFLFGRLFDNLIDREIKLSDFKNNILELDNLPLSAKKINNSYLNNSPYKLKEGVIGKLKIQIASFKDLATKDIEVQIDKVHLVLAFGSNYHKQKNFQMGQNNNVPEPEIQEIDLKDEDEEEEEFYNENGKQKQGKQDMFKQFIRQVLSNIKLSVNDLVVDLYMNKDGLEKQSYAMLRLKKLKIYQQKKDEVQKKLKVQKEKSENLYWIKMKEISAFIIKPTKKQSDLKEFPFSYPTINDSQCIFTTSFKMKQFRQAVQSQNNKVFDNLNSSYLFDFSKSMVEKDVKNQNFDDESFLPNHLQIETLFNPNDATVKSVKIYIPPIEVQLDPIQLKVLSNFYNQLSSYQKMRKINEYKRNNFCQIGNPIFNTDNRQHKQKVLENKSQHEQEDFENLQQLKSVIVTDNSHFQIKQGEENEIRDKENEQREMNDKKEDSQNPNLSKSQNSSQSDEFDLMNQIQFDFYNTQFDFKIFAINVYLLKRHIKVDEDKRILPMKQEGGDIEEICNNQLYLRNWIYYYDEMNEKIFYPREQVSEQVNKISKVRIQNQQGAQNNACQIYIDKTSFNDTIPCSYFLFQLKAFKIITHSPTKKVISIRSVKLIDVNLIDNCGIFSEIKQNPLQPIQPAQHTQYVQSSQLAFPANSHTENSKICSQYSKVQQAQNIEKSYSEEIFQSALEHFGQSQIRQQNRDSYIQNGSQYYKSIKNDQNGDDEMFYSMSEIQPSLLQSSRVSMPLEQITEETQENKKPALDLKPWQINQSYQHYCISYILLIKSQKKPNQQPKNVYQNARNISRVQYKQDILFNQNWLSEEKQKNQSDLAFSLELIKRGNVIDGQANIGCMYTSFDLRILRDIYQIIYPCDEWVKFTEQYEVYDSRLQRTENITLLDQYYQQSEQIEKFQNALNQKKQKDEEAKQQKEPLQVEFSLNIQKFKFVYLSYQEKNNFKQALRKYDMNSISSLMCFNNTTCFCSNLMKQVMNNKKYLAENFAVQFNNINFTYQKSADQNTTLQLRLEKAVVGLLKINKDLCLESVEPIFKFNNLLDIESVKLDVVLVNQQQFSNQSAQVFNSNQMNLNIGQLQVNVQNVNKILALVEKQQSLFQDYQNLLKKLQKFDREVSRSSRTLIKKENSNDEDKSEDGQGQDFDFNEGLSLQFNSQYLYEQEPEVSNFLSEFQLQIYINKLDIRIIYLKSYKNSQNAKNANANSPIKNPNKGTLLSYILKEQTDKKYSPFAYQLIPQNFCIQFILRHSIIAIDRGQQLNLKLYEIYLVDHLQTKIKLGNYKKYQQGEDLTFNSSIQISSELNELENKLLIYSTSYYDPKLIEEEHNLTESNFNIIDLDKNERGRRNSAFLDQNKKQNQSHIQGQEQRDASKIKPVIYLKVSYKVEQQNIKVKSDPKNILKIQEQNQNNLSDLAVSEDGEEEQPENDNVIKKTKNKIIFSSIAIQDFIIRFGDFRSEIIQNFLDIANLFEAKPETIPKENAFQNEVIQIVQSQQEQNDNFPKQFAQVKQNETVTQIEIGNLYINNVTIDIFPFHDKDIRQKLPKVYENIAEQNKKGAFFTNQRSVLLLRNIMIKKLKYRQTDIYKTFSSQPAFSINQNTSYETKKKTENNLEFQLEIKGLDLYTLVFDDQKKYLNPLVLCRQNFVFRDINSQESRVHLDNKQYDVVNQLEQLGFYNVIEIECSMQLKQARDSFSIALQIEKLYVNACKDSIISFPLHITLISLLFQRLTESLTKEQNIELSNSQQSNQSPKNQRNSLQKSQKQQNQQENINQNNVNINSQRPIQSKDSLDFEVFGEEFEIEEEQNFQFQNNAKDQDIEYFHKHNQDDQMPITYLDFTINKFEIQIFSGKDFDFDTKQKITMPVRVRLQKRDTKQNLLLTFNKLTILYSQFATTKKINLCIHGIELQGTVGNSAQLIIQKKDSKQKMILIDISIDELKRLISLRTYLSRIKLTIDKVHKQLLEDLSQMHIDLDQISVSKSQIKPEHNEAILFNKGSKIYQQSDPEQEIPLQEEIKLDNQKDEEFDNDDYEICNGQYNESEDADNQFYKLSLIQICPIEIEITVNWFVNSILKDSVLIFDQYYNSKEKGITFDQDLVFYLQSHYYKTFDVHIMKNRQILQIMSDVVLIRNITNITKNLANIVILPYKSFKNNGRIATGLIEGVKGFQQSIFTETRNFLSVVSNIYSSYIKQNIMKITKIKKLLKNKKKNV